MARLSVIGLVGKSLFFELPHFHAGGETVTATGYHEEWGGKGFNQAVAAARQGAQVSFLGACAAADVAAIAEFARNEGVVAQLAQKTRATASAAILTDGTGETRVTVYPGAALEPADVEAFVAAIAEADFLLLNNEVPEAVNCAAVRIACEHDVKIIFNPAPAQTLPPTIVDAVALFTPNECEESALGTVSGEVVTTLGAKGCRIRSTGEIIPAPTVQAVDSTGAGDTFNAVLATRLAEGADLRTACVAANAAAAASVSVRYVMPSLPRRGDAGGS
ncbi:MAG: PfkB family carbohydrate kinase [Kiritimatiellae bacterium]|nr:PfkB family carbohydrate kinase [Kiritimatiellia bacterium]